MPIKHITTFTFAYRLRAALLALTFCAFTYPACAAATDADSIIAKADDIRMIQEDNIVNVTVTSVFSNGEKTVYRYEVMVKGKTKTLVKTLSPRTERGRSLLMRDNDFWAFLPGVSKPVRISLQQRLVGEVSNGDIARANFSGDYKAKALGIRSVNGVSCLLFYLTAVNESVTYGKVRYWVRADDYSPVKAEFYAVSGRLLKTCSFEAYKEIGGRQRPSRLILRNPLAKGQYSVIEYEGMARAELPERYFTKDYMKKLKY